MDCRHLTARSQMYKAHANVNQSAKGYLFRAVRKPSLSLGAIVHKLRPYQDYESPVQPLFSRPKDFYLVPLNQQRDVTSHGESVASEATHTTQLARVRLADDEERSTNYIATMAATRPQSPRPDVGAPL